MRWVLLAFYLAVTLFSSPVAFGQSLVRPAIFTQSRGGEEPSEQTLFSSGDVTLPFYDKSQFGASSRVYTVSVYGFPKCTQDNGQQVCVSRYWFNLSVDSNVVSAITDATSSIREYIFSQKGSPLTLSVPVHTWTTKKGDVRQTWFAFSPTGSARIIPVTVGTNSLSGGGAFSLGGIGEANIEFDATEPGTAQTGAETTYPGTLYFSVTPTISAMAGGALKAAAFQNSPISNWVWGGEYRAGFQFKGKKPISIGITGTFSAKGLTSSSNGVAFSLSKLFGGSR